MENRANRLSWALLSVPIAFVIGLNAWLLVPTPHPAHWSDWVTAIAAAVSAVAAVGALIVIVVTARFALRGLNDARLTRHGQLLTELQRQWDNPVIVESIAEHAFYGRKQLADLVDVMFGPGTKRPTANQRKAWVKLSMWPNLIENMGVLVAEGAITDEAIYRVWGGGIIVAWKKWRRAVLKLRQYDNEPDTYEYFQAVGSSMRRIDRERRRARAEAAAT